VKDNVILIYKDKAVPATLAIPSNIIHNVPMSLWLVKKSHLNARLVIFSKVV
jgi:hypothetical protein